MIKHFRILSLVLFALGSIFELSAQMKPIKVPGRFYGHYYYYSKQDINPFTLKDSKELIGKVLSLKKLKQLCFAKKVKKAPELDLTDHMNPTQTVPEQSSIEPKITWIGHASFLIQINGFNILTDPIFGDIKVLNDPFFRLLGYTVALPGFTLVERAFEPGIRLEDLPPIDLIIISHDHSDHTDAVALRILAKKYNPRIVIPEGKKALMKKFGFTKITEKSWWGKRHFSKDGRSITLTCVPALHWSIRFSPLSYRESLWNGWMISSADKNIYFAGDSAAGPHFKEIAQAFPSIDVALMPIGPTHEGENLHRQCHVDAPEAIDAFITLGAKQFIPMHYGTFKWGSHQTYYPLKRLPEAWHEKKDQLADKELLLAQCGHTYTIN